MSDKTPYKAFMEMESPIQRWVLEYPNGNQVRGLGSKRECELFFAEFPKGTGFEKHFISWSKKENTK